jgi:hypothetical protein
MSFLRILLPLVIASMPSSVGSSDASTIRVLVLDALDGKAQAEVSVGYLCDEIPHTTNYAITNNNGIAEVPYSCQPGRKIELWAVPKTPKREGCGSGAASTLEEIKAVGVISKPDSDGGIWCPTKVSRTLTAVPGQVTLFVKKPTWWQSHVAG